MSLRCGIRRASVAGGAPTAPDLVLMGEPELPAAARPGVRRWERVPSTVADLVPRPSREPPTGARPEDHDRRDVLGSLMPLRSPPVCPRPSKCEITGEQGARGRVMALAGELGCPREILVKSKSRRL